MFLPVVDGAACRCRAAYIEEWRRWCLRPDHFGPDLRTYLADNVFAEIRAPVLNVGIQRRCDRHAPHGGRARQVLSERGARVALVLACRRRQRMRIGHEGFFASRHRDTLWRPVFDWLDARLGIAVMSHAAPADHITPYDRFALNEASLVALLASRDSQRRAGRILRAALYADLAKLARATQRPPAAPAGACTCCPASWARSSGFMRGGQQTQRHSLAGSHRHSVRTAGRADAGAGLRAVALGSMSYTYLKITLSLRKAGFDAVLLDYDWRRDVATLGKLLAERIAADGKREGGAARPQHGRPRGARRAHARRRRPGLAAAHARHAECRLAGRHPGIARHVFRGAQDRHAGPAARCGIPRQRSVRDFSGCARTAAAGARRQLDLFEPDAWPAAGPRPEAAMLRRTAGLANGAWRPRMRASTPSSAATASPPPAWRCATAISSMSTACAAMAPCPSNSRELKGARHRYVDCGHSDLPLSDRVIAGTIDLLKTGSTRRFAAKPRIRRTSRTRVSDTELRQRIPGQGRLAAHESRGTQAVPRYAQRAAEPPAARFNSGPRIRAATSREAREPPPGKTGVISTPAASAVTLTSRSQLPSRGSNHRQR